MPQNIQSWQVKEIKGLQLAAEYFFGVINGMQHYVPEIETVGYHDGVLFMTIALTDDGCFANIAMEFTTTVAITNLGLSGEGSSRIYHEMLEPLLKKSLGTLKALIVWDGGELIEKLIVEDGEVSLEGIDVW